MGANRGARIVLASATGAGDSSEVLVPEGRSATFVMGDRGDLAAETGDVQIKHPFTDTWDDLYLGGSQQQLSATNNAITVYGPGRYRVSCSARTTAFGVAVYIDPDT